MSGNSAASRSSVARLCACPLRNQRSGVGPQSVSSSGPAGYRLRDRKRVSVGATFHAPGRQVEDRRARVRRHQPLVQHGHPGHGCARVLVEHERVPRGEQRPRQRGDHDRVVDVGDDAEADVRGQDADRRLDRLGALGAAARCASPVRGSPPRRRRRSRRGPSAPRAAGRPRPRPTTVVGDGERREAAPAAHRLDPFRSSRPPGATAPAPSPAPRTACRSRCTG